MRFLSQVLKVCLGFFSLRGEISTQRIIQQKEPEFEDLENLQSFHVVKYEKVYFGENTKGVAGHLFVKRLGMLLDLTVLAEMAVSLD
jgi:hypothetical protein